MSTDLYGPKQNSRGGGVTDKLTVDIGYNYEKMSEQNPLLADYNQNCIRHISILLCCVQEHYKYNYLL